MQKEGDDMFGETIKKIRKSKNMTLKEAAGEALSVSQLSRFENGHSMITIDLFYEILTNLNTSTDEFNYIMSLDDNKKLNDYSSRIEEYANSLRYDRLKDLIDEIKAVNPAPYSWDQFLIYFIESVIALDKTHEKEISPAVLDYLMQVEVWGEMELRIYALFGFALDVETTHFLMRTALKRSKQYLKIPSNTKLLYVILSNNFSSFLAFDRIDYARETLELFETEYAQNTPHLAAHIDFIFNKGLLAFKENRPEDGNKHCQNAIKICQDFHQTEYEKMYTERYENWRLGYNNPEFKEVSIGAGFFD